jgi:tetratricopeptide (TPR) repeat protein
MKTQFLRHTGPYRRVAALSLVAGLVASCSPHTPSPKREAVAAHAGQTDVTLLAHIDEALSQALNTLLEAETLFEAEAKRGRHPGEPDWGREHNWMFIGEAYERLGQPDQALVWLEQACNAAPGLERAKKSYERCRKTMESISQ